MLKVLRFTAAFAALVAPAHASEVCANGVKYAVEDSDSMSVGTRNINGITTVTISRGDRICIIDQEGDMQGDCAGIEKTGTCKSGTTRMRVEFKWSD